MALDERLWTLGAKSILQEQAGAWAGGKGGGEGDRRREDRERHGGSVAGAQEWTGSYWVA